MSETVPTLEELTALCRDWQARLRLQDWRVRIRYSEKYELKGKQAYCERDRLLKTAAVTINPFCIDEDPDEAIAPFEERVIHELLHLHFDMLLDLEKGSISHTLMEQSVDCIAWALYRAKYGDKVEDKFLIV